MERLCDLFADRFIGAEEVHDDDPWSRILVSLIPKCISPSTISDFRPISVIPVLCKLYLRCICNYISPGINAALPPSVHGYRRGYQTIDEIQSLRQVIEKSNEWNLTLCFAKTDIIKAYDLLKTETIMEALRYHNVSDHITLAILREWQGQKQFFSWGTAVSEEVRRQPKGTNSPL